MMNNLIVAALLGLSVTFAAATGSGSQAPSGSPRFDELVRADFFAGIAGDAAAMDRAMRLIDAALAQDPDHAEALVWRGAGFVARAQQTFEKGDVAAGTDLFQRGLADMDRAVALTPENVGVLIPRGAVLLETSRGIPDPATAKTLLATAVADYERVLVLQAPYFKYLSDHARGELLFGLAEGLHRLGERQRARAYFERLLSEAKGSEYGKMADAWLQDPTAASAKQRACVGCHAKPAKPAEPVDPFAAATTRLERAVVTGSATELRAVRSDLLRMAAQRPPAPRASLIEYTVAYTAWRMAFMPGMLEREADEALDDGVERLQRVIEAEGRDAEAQALLGALYGAQIGRSALKAMTTGPRAMAAINRAASLAPDNPRVALQEGISALNTPGMFGGGIDKAERSLRRSVQLFGQEPRDRSWPNWGRVDAHAWLGQTLRRKGDKAGARAEYDKALAIEPESRLVRNALLPALDRTSP